jgi:hypothetical protein
MDVQTELQKIRHQYGTSEKANYEIQKLFDSAIKEAIDKTIQQQVEWIVNTALFKLSEEFRRWNQQWSNFDNGKSLIKPKNNEQFIADLSKRYVAYFKPK